MNLTVTALFKPGEKISVPGALGLVWMSARADVDDALRRFKPLGESLTGAIRELGLEARVSVTAPPGGTGPAFVGVDVRRREEEKDEPLWPGPVLDALCAAAAAPRGASLGVSPGKEGEDEPFVTECSVAADCGGFLFMLRIRVIGSKAPTEFWGG